MLLITHYFFTQIQTVIGSQNVQLLRSNALLDDIRDIFLVSKRLNYFTHQLSYHGGMGTRDHQLFGDPSEQ